MADGEARGAAQRYGGYAVLAVVAVAVCGSGGVAVRLRRRRRGRGARARGRPRRSDHLARRGHGRGGRGRRTAASDGGGAFTGVLDSHRPEIGEPAPDFALADARDPSRIVRLSDFRGRPVVLNWYASWCGPCRAEIPDFQRAYKALDGEVVFLGVNLQEEASRAVGLLDVPRGEVPGGARRGRRSRRALPPVGDAYDLLHRRGRRRRLLRNGAHRRGDARGRAGEARRGSTPPDAAAPRGRASEASDARGNLGGEVLGALVRIEVHVLEDHLLEAKFGQPAQLLDDLAGRAAKEAVWPSMRSRKTRGEASGSRPKCAIVFAVTAARARASGAAKGKTIMERAIDAGVAPDRLAVTFERLDLARVAFGFGDGHAVPLVGVLGGDAQGAALARAPDEHGADGRAPGCGW